MKKIAVKTKKVVKLSAQEEKVLRLLLMEFKGHEIARIMELDERTIGTYKLRLLKKTESKTIIGLYKYNLKHKIVETVIYKDK
jgi:DNA-binding NarL/FixJ family response regulator